MNHSPFLQQVLDELGKRMRADVEIKAIHPEYGGSINDSYHLVTSAGSFFLKRNSAAQFPEMFRTEAEGLKLLKKCTELAVPEVLAHGQFEETGYLVLEYFEKGAMRKDFWEDFGRQLARLHHHTQSTFGLDYENYIGSLRQTNGTYTNWHDFFIAQRIQPLVKKARDAGRLNEDIAKKFDALITRLPSLIPVDRPALLHGDLWSGNFMVHATGRAGIYDPAVYFGHREADIAMTHLFGGFHNSMWKAYDEEYALLPGWSERIDLHNLYPLLVHVNLFGVTYVRQIDSILNQFS